MPTLNYTKLTDRNVSFSLIRTNPKLTSNVKISVNEAGDIWMNSIDANESLASQKYKRIPINPDSDHAVNVFRFYDNGKTPTKISFDIGQSIRTDVMARDLKDQYNFDLYTSGAKYLSSQYSEKFSYFAPIYLDAVIPEYFVILRIPGSSNYSVGEWKQKIADPNFNQTSFATDFFKNAKIVKTISLGEESKIGTYIRNIRRNKMYVSNPLYVNFKENGYSLYRGISIGTGTYTEAPELLNQVLQKSIGQLKLEKYIVGGFERNNLIHPKILNLEFLFTDETSDEYSINRYFGFYCNAVDLINFNLNFVQMYENDSDNATPLTRIYSKFEETSLNIQNPNGVFLRGSGITEDLSFLSNTLTDSNSIIFPYLKTKDDSLHFIKSISSNENAQAFSQRLTDIAFSLDDTTFNIGKTFGPNNLVSQEISQEVIQDTRSTVLLQVPEMPNHLDTLRIYHQNGSTFDSLDSNGKYDDLVFVKNYFASDTPYSIDYIGPDQIEFQVPIDPNLGSAVFLPNQPEIEDVQYVSIENGTLWKWNGSEYIEDVVIAPVGDPVNFYMDETADPNSPDQEFTPNIQTLSTSTYSIEEAVLTFTVSSVAPFEVDDFVKIVPDSTRYMLGQITSIDETLLEITINVTETKGGGEYSNWRIIKMPLASQLISAVDGSQWRANGKRFIRGTGNSRIYVNADGTDTAVLTQSIESIIADLQYTHLITDRLDNNIFIQSRSFGDTYGSLALQNLSSASAFLINGKNTTDLILADGGNFGSQVIIPVGNIERLTPRLEEIVVKTHIDWSNINRVCNSAAFINNGFGSLTIDRINSYLASATLMLAEDERVLVSYDKIEIRDIFEPSIGLLSVFEIKDIDFDTYSSQYAKTPEIDLYQYYFLPAEAKVLDFNNYAYRLLGNGTIDINGYIYSTESISDLVWQPTTDLTAYQVLSGDPVLTYSNYLPGKNYDFYLKSIARSLTGSTFDFTPEQEISLTFSKKSQSALSFDFQSAQAGYITAVDEIIDLLTTLIPSTPGVPEVYTVESGLLYSAGDTVRIYSGLNEYITGTVISYTADQLEVELTSENRTLDEFENPTVIRVDDADLFPKYRMTNSLNRESYLEVQLSQLGPVGPPTSINIFNVLSVSGPTPVGGSSLQWDFSKIVTTETALRSDIGIFDEDNNLQSFTGFFGLGADHSLPITTSNTYQIRDKYLSTTLKSEYDIYLENFSREFATDNRLVPYIAKWGAIDSTDSRANPYRLNTDISFGKDNFGPSHRETIPTAEKLTHEWFYIESSFNYKLDPEILKKNYYYFDQPIDINRLISEPAYFETYFTYIPVYNESEVERPQFRYSKLLKNRYTNKYETIFNGAKFVFSELNDRGDELGSTTRFENYNFSIMLKPVRENILAPQKPVNYRIIENTDARSILVLIEIALSGRDKIGHNLLFNSDDLPGARLDQTNLLSKLYLTSNEIYYPQVDVIYTTEDSPAGEALFLNLSLDNIDAINLTDLSAGTAIDAKTGQEIVGYSLQPSQTVIFRKFGTTNEMLVSMPGTEIFNLQASLKLVDVCQSAILENDIYPVYKVSNTRRFVLNGKSYQPVRIFRKMSGSLDSILTTTDYLFPIRLVTSTWKSMFGDFRLSFNEESVSNLTYAFLYAVKDKKFNTSKSAFSAVKLAKGISLSSDIGLPANDIGIEQIYALPSQTLAGLPERAFTIDGFINPASGGFSDSGSFSPIMLINSSGKATLVLRTGFDTSAHSLSQNILDLQNSRITGSPIQAVNISELTLLKPGPLTQPVDYAYETPIGPSGPVFINTSNDYTDQIIQIIQRPALRSEPYRANDLVKLVNGSSVLSPFSSAAVILTGRVIEQFLWLDSANVEYTATTIEIYDQSAITPSTGIGSIQNGSWLITKTESLRAIDLQIASSESQAVLQLGDNTFPVPGTSTQEWVNNHQQFQLFGGTDHFTNLFENISFANFIKQIETDSEILTWETYTGGQLQTRISTGNKFFRMEIEQADTVKKKTIVKPIEQVIETSSKIEVGGYEPTERASTSYDLFRYSSEYEVLFKPVSAFTYFNRFGGFNLDGANVRFNTNVSNFFVLPELFYVKYSDRTILDLESASKFSATYPLIGESPIDHDHFNALSSSWDFNYHYKYSTKKDKTAIAGSNRITEDYSFISKLINLPENFTIEPTQFNEVSQTIFDESDRAFIERNLDFVYAVYPALVKIKVNLSKLIAKALVQNGVGQQFSLFFKDSQNQTIEADPEVLDDLTLSEYSLQYCEKNLVNLFQLSALDCFAKPDYSLADNSVSFIQIDYDNLESLGYSKISRVQINNSKSTVLTFTVPKISSSGIKLVPKLKINYI